MKSLASKLLESINRANGGVQKKGIRRPSRLNINEATLLKKVSPQELYKKYGLSDLSDVNAVFEKSVGDKTAIVVVSGPCPEYDDNPSVHLELMNNGGEKFWSYIEESGDLRSAVVRGEKLAMFVNNSDDEVEIAEYAEKLGLEEAF